MKVSTINQFFGKIGRLQIQWRVPILCVFIILTLFCCLGLTKFEIQNSSEGWYGEGDILKQNKDTYEAIFGNRNNAAVLVVADDVFSQEILEVIDRLGQRMITEIPYADKLTSLIELDIPIGTEEGYNIIKPYENGIPSDKTELQAKRNLILRGTEHTNACKNVLVSDDGTETWITLTLLPFDDPDEDPAAVGYALNDILESDEFKSDSYKLYGCGQPYFDVQEELYEYPDYLLRVLLGFGIMIVFLAIFIQDPLGVIIPSVSTIGAITSVLGLMSYFGEKADSILITLPILLGIALSVGYSIHYINIFKTTFRYTGNRKEAAIKTVEEAGWSVFFTVLTTVASLFSFIFVNMKQLSWMGRTAALIVLFVYLYVTVLIPICMSFGKNRPPKAVKEKGATKIDLTFQRWADVTYNRRYLILILSVLIMGTCVPFFTKIKFKLNFLEMTGTKLPHMQLLQELLDKKLGNQYSYDVMISYDEPDTFKDPEKMAAVQEFETFLGTLSMTKTSGTKPRVSSVTDILKEMNRALNEGQDEFYTVPEDPYILAQLMELSSIEMTKDFSECMDDEFKVLTISVDMLIFDSASAIQDIKAINEKLAELFPDAQSCILGDMIEYAEMTNRMVWGELKSFLFSFVIIAIMLTIAFSSIRTGLIAMIPNVAPVILVGGFMGFSGYAMDFATMTTMPIILGIAVDDTIHLTTHLKLGLEKYGTYKGAMEASLREIGKSMFMSTLILCSIYAVYLFSPIRYLFVIGILSILGLSGALIADYTITPVLLYLVKPFGKERSN